MEYERQGENEVGAPKNEATSSWQLYLTSLCPLFGMATRWWLRKSVRCPGWTKHPDTVLKEPDWVERRWSDRGTVAAARVTHLRAER